MGIQKEIHKVVDDTISLLGTTASKTKVLAKDFTKETLTAFDKLKDLCKTNYKLGIYHYEHGNLGDAIFRLKLVQWAFDKKVSNDANYYIGKSYLEQKNSKKTNLGIEYLTKYIEHTPNIKNAPQSAIYEAAEFSIKMAKHKIIDTDSIPFMLIQRRFKLLAPQYDEVQINNEHSSQIVLTEILLDEINKIDKSTLNNVLDIGCGTGLIGAACRHSGFVKALCGIDISKEMLKHAKDKKYGGNAAYSEIIYNDVDSYFDDNRRKRKNKYNIIIAADFLQYYGDVEAFFQLINNLSQKKTILSISFPKAEGVKNKYFTYKQQYFVFSENYIKALAQKNKWKLEKQKNTSYSDGTKGIAMIFTKT
jgi:predicted TPR repeat methyltransferase